VSSLHAWSVMPNEVARRAEASCEGWETSLVLSAGRGARFVKPRSLSLEVPQLRFAPLGMTI
jgi:hypothetical protein